MQCGALKEKDLIEIRRAKRCKRRIKIPRKNMYFYVVFRDEMAKKRMNIKYRVN